MMWTRTFGQLLLTLIVIAGIQAQVASRATGSRPGAVHSASAPNSAVEIADSSDDNIPGVALPLSPVSGSLTKGSDGDDVYAISLQAGQKLTATITGQAGTDFALYLFPPAATNIERDADVARAYGYSYPETLSYLVPPGLGGVYYLDVYDFKGTGTYTLTWEVIQVPPDDYIPGVALPASPVADSVDKTLDSDDVYAIELQPGQKLTATISGAAGTDFDLILFPPAATDLESDDDVAGAYGNSYPDTLSYLVPPGQGGVYYLDVYVYKGAGSYTLTWQVIQCPPDDYIPGVALPTSPVAGSLDKNSDSDDVYAIELQAGQKLTASISGVAGTDFDLILFAPAATDLATGDRVAAASVGSYPDALSYGVPAGKGGIYYLDAYSYQGAGNYTLTWQVGQADADYNAPGVTLPASPVTGSLSKITDSDDVYAIALQAGQKLVLSLNGGAGTNFNIHLFPPGTTDINSDKAVAHTYILAYPDTLTYYVPFGKGGIYYLDLRGYSGTGDYALTWQVSQAESDYNIPGVALPASPVAGTLDKATDADDVYALRLQAGQKLVATVNGDAGTNFVLYIYSPTATDVYVDNTAERANGGAYPHILKYTIPAGQGGDYYLRVWAYTGAGSYTLTWQVIEPEADDNIPGVAIPTLPPAAGALDEAIDINDVYAIELQVGNKLTASISGDVGTEFVLQLCPPATTDLATGARVAYSGGSTYPRTLKYSVPLGKAGIYYLNLQAYEGVGNYTLTWEVTQDEPDYNIPGVALPASPVSGTLDENTDRDDIYAIPLQAGQKLLATISGSAGTDFDLWLFAPAATNVNADYYVRIADKKYYPETLVYSVVAGKGGTYYLDVCVYQGTGAYTLDWRVVAAEPDDNVPGVALPPPPVTGGLDEQTDVDDVYYVDLRVGDVLTVTLDREVHSDLFLFGPDSQDVQADEFLLGTVDLETRTKTLSYPVTQAGRYYLDVYLQSGAGTYTLDWRPARNVTHDWPLYE